MSCDIQHICSGFTEMTYGPHLPWAPHSSWWAPWDTDPFSETHCPRLRETGTIGGGCPGTPDAREEELLLVTLLT